jgi:hypothetical protein
MVGGMDVFVLTYAELKEAALITNDLALWFVAWKKGIRSYWLQGLRNEHVLRISNDEEVVYPTW